MSLLEIDFEPDATTLGLLGAEHQNGTWVGKELLPIANRIRNQGGDEDDYYRWVLSSTLWTSYKYSTGDSTTEHGKHLESAWDKAQESKPFELDDALADVEDRIRAAAWAGKAGRRNQAVALAFVRYCRDRNCYTRTLSRYELAKETPGIASPDTVGKGLAALVDLGLLVKENRVDRRSSGRSTSRYRINLYWTGTAEKPIPSKGRSPIRPAGGSLRDSLLGKSNGISQSRSTSKSSLTCFCQSGDSVHAIDLSVHDLWSRKGLGPTALQVWSLLEDHPGHDVMALADPASFYEDDSVEHVGKSADDLVSDSGLSRRTVDTVLRKLFDNCLALELPGRPRRWLRAAYPPVEPLADELGCAGALADQIERIEARQEANRIAYPANYTNQRKSA